LATTIYCLFAHIAIFFVENREVDKKRALNNMDENSIPVKKPGLKDYPFCLFL
jgi:hypothetical protein